MNIADIRKGDMVKVDGRWFLVGHIAQYFGTELETEIQIIHKGGASSEYRYASEIQAHEARPRN